MPQTRNPASALFFFLFVLWLLFPEGDYQTHSLVVSEIAAQQLARYHDALDVLNTTRWGDFRPRSTTSDTDDEQQSPNRYLNLTGFREEDGLAWEELENFREKGLRLSRYAIPPAHGQQLWDAADGEVVWANASGTLCGDWVRRSASVPRTYQSYNLSRVAPTMDWMGDKLPWARNMTGDTGRMLLKLEGNRTLVEYEELRTDDSPAAGGLIRGVRATATMEDSQGTGQNWDMRLWGVHWPKEGIMIMTTTSEKFEGIFGLPHLTPGPDFFQSSQRLLNESIGGVMAKKEHNIYVDQNAPWSSDLENPMYTSNPSPHCEYIMYAQVHPPTDEDLRMSPSDLEQETKQHAIQAIESELASPLGAPVHHIPSLRVSAVVYSPDCAFYLETKGPPESAPGEANHLVGMKTEIHLHKIKNWILVYAAAVFAQVFLLKNQIRESYTPSNMGRVSFATASIMVIVDGMTFTAAATWVSSAAATFLPTMALMFASFLSMTIGGSFLSRVYEVQLPERRNRRDRDSSNSADASAANSQPDLTQGTSGSEPLLPAPVTARRPAPAPSEPVFIPSDQDIDAEIAEGASAVPRPTNTTAQQRASTPQPTTAQTFQAIVGRYILLSLCIMFLAISSTTWYASLRALFLNFCTFLYMSFWVPQIYRNIMRNCRRALNWQFVVGQSVLRILPIAYFWTNPDNFLFARTDVHAFLLLCCWVWLQIFVLVAQDAVGPRFGIPTTWTPEAWDYHPVLREDNIEAGGLPIGLVGEDEQRRSTDEQRNSGMRAIDCAICRELLEVPVVKSGEEDMSVVGVFARRMYMVTPCRHIFHSTCLEGWLKFRLQCPICREELPPL